MDKVQCIKDKLYKKVFLNKKMSKKLEKLVKDILFDLYIGFYFEEKIPKEQQDFNKGVINARLLILKEIQYDFCHIYNVDIEKTIRKMASTIDL